MTTLQKSIIAVVITGALAVGVYEARQASGLRGDIQAQQSRQVALSNRVQELERELERSKNMVASISRESATAKNGPNEVLKLRGEVGRLRLENASIGSTNALSKVTANPESRKLLRDQQKLGMGMIYKSFAQTASLTPDQTEKLNDLLADHIMDNVDHVTQVLRDKATREQINDIFTAQDSVLQEKVQALLGEQGLSQYQDYTKNLLSTLSSEQFKGKLTGSDTEKEQKTKQLFEAMQAEVKATLTSSGLPPDFQLVPILNFRNIASEEEAVRNLKLLEDVFEHVAAQAGAFLDADEMKKFQEFKTAAINNNRLILNINRTMMAPIAQ